jgi:hypothetical protein
MDPETSLDVVSAVMSLAIDGGMNPDWKSVAFEASDTGDVSVKSIAGDGTEFALVVPGDAIAAALGMEPAAEGEESAPADAAPAQPPAK